MILFEALQAVINAQAYQNLRGFLEHPAGFSQKQAKKADKTKSTETAAAPRKRSNVTLTYQALQELWTLYQNNKTQIEGVLQNPKNAQLKGLVTALQAAQAPIAAFIEKNTESENIFNEFLKHYKPPFPTTDTPAAPALKAFLEIMFTEEGNPLPEDLYKKFQGVFGSMREVMVYLNAYKEDVKKSVKKGFSVHDALLFELPDFEGMTEEWRTFWHGMAKEHLKDTPFRKILGQANDLTQFMADNEKALEAEGVENFAILHKKLKESKDLETELTTKLRTLGAEERTQKVVLREKLKTAQVEIKNCEYAIAGYDLGLMSELPRGDPEQAVPGKIYLNKLGYYYVRAPNGNIEGGRLTVVDSIFLNYLKDSLNDEGFKQQVLQHTLQAGHTPPGSDLNSKLVVVRKQINASLTEERSIKTLRTALVGDPNPERDRLNVLRTEQEKITAAYQLELVQLAPTMAEITLTDILAYKTAYIQKMQGSLLGYFTNNQLTLKDFEYFQTLCASPGNKTAGKNLPDMQFDFERNGKRYYVKKLHVQNPEEAAIAACLGKLTGCCQYLGGVGADCAVHGLTNENSGFYVVCRGDINHPKITDPLEGQCWAWRSQTGAIVFDSVEPNRSGDRNIIDLGKHAFRELAHKLVSTGVTHKVDCGDSGMSRSVGVFTKNALETLENYTGYSDARKKQLEIYNKEKPYYLYEEEDWAKQETLLLLERLLSSQDSKDTAALLKLVEFANRDTKSTLYTHLSSLEESRVKRALRLLSFIATDDVQQSETELQEILEDLTGVDAHLYFTLQGKKTLENLFFSLRFGEEFLEIGLNSESFKALSAAQKMSVFTQESATSSTLTMAVIQTKNGAALKTMLSYLSEEERLELLNYSKKNGGSELDVAMQIQSYPGMLTVILEHVSDAKKVEFLYYKGLNENVVFSMLTSDVCVPVLVQHAQKLAADGDIKTLMRFMGYAFYNQNEFKGESQGFHIQIQSIQDETIQDLLKIYAFFDARSKDPEWVKKILDLFEKNPEYWYATGMNGGSLLHDLSVTPDLLQQVVDALKKLPPVERMAILTQKNQHGHSVFLDVLKKPWFGLSWESVLKIFFEGLTEEERFYIINKRPQDYKLCLGASLPDMKDAKAGELYLYPDKTYVVRRMNGSLQASNFSVDSSVFTNYLHYFDHLESHLQDAEFKREVLRFLALNRIISYEDASLIDVAVEKNNPAVLDFLLSHITADHRKEILYQPEGGVNNLVVYTIQKSTEGLSVLLKHYDASMVTDLIKDFYMTCEIISNVESLKVVLKGMASNPVALFQLFKDADLLVKAALFPPVLKILLSCFSQFTEEQKLQLLSREITMAIPLPYKNTFLSHTVSNVASFKQFIGVVLSLSPENREKILQERIGGETILYFAAHYLKSFEFLLPQLTGTEILDMLVSKNANGQYSIFDKENADVFPLVVKFLDRYPEHKLSMLCTPEALAQAATNPAWLVETLDFLDLHPEQKKTLLNAPDDLYKVLQVASRKAPAGFLRVMRFLEDLSAETILKLLAKKDNSISALFNTLDQPSLWSVVFKIISESLHPEQSLMEHAVMVLMHVNKDLIQQVVDLLKKASPQRRFELFNQTGVGIRGTLLLELVRSPERLAIILPLLEDLSEPQLFSLLSETTSTGRNVLMCALEDGTLETVLKLMEKLTPVHQLALLTQQKGSDGRSALDTARAERPAALPLLEERLQQIQTAQLTATTPTVLLRPMSPGTPGSGTGRLPDRPAPQDPGLH